ncbi:hypothetical protein ACFL1B_04755 [Nanoarchaeota archaeon]
MSLEKDVQGLFQLDERFDDFSEFQEPTEKPWGSNEGKFEPGKPREQKDVRIEVDYLSGFSSIPKRDDFLSKFKEFYDARAGIETEALYREPQSFETEVRLQLKNGRLKAGFDGDKRYFWFVMGRNDQASREIVEEFIGLVTYKTEIPK